MQIFLYLSLAMLIQHCDNDHLSNILLFYGGLSEETDKSCTENVGTRYDAFGYGGGSLLEIEVCGCIGFPYAF